MPRLHSCVKNELYIQNQTNIPLLLHAPTLIDEVFNESRSDTLTQRMASKLSSFNVLSQEFAKSVANDAPQRYSLKKLMATARNDNIAYNNEITAMSANLGYITNPIVSNSIPWMTYINTFLIIGIIIFLVPCNKVPTVATASTAASMLPMSTKAFSIAQQDTVTVMNLTLDFALTICIIAIVTLYLWKVCYKDRKNKLIKTVFQLTLYAGEDEISLELGKSAFKVTDTTEFTSPNTTLLPKISVSLSMIIDWQNYVLQTNKSQFNLPTIIKLKPWHLPLLHRVVPNLKALQLTALCAGQQIQSWTIFYPDPEGITV
jgi:hypothetical protein